MWRGTSPSWTVTANQGAVRRIKVQRDVSHKAAHVSVIWPADHILSFTVLPQLPVFGRKSWNSWLDSASFLNLDII